MNKIKDKVYLAGSLAEHRRSRLLVQLLDAEGVETQADDLPEHGICLLFGKEYQQADGERQRAWQLWCQRPGRTLLLIPPYVNGPVHELADGVDWFLEFSEGVKGQEGSIAELVADETVFVLQSEQPAFDRDAGHQWLDYSYNTLFNKSHSASGLFAATTLPLWSISLLDMAEELQQWLGILHGLAGKASEESMVASDDSGLIQLEEKDYTVLACVYAYGLTNAEKMREFITSQPLPLFKFDSEWLAGSFERLVALDYVQEAITEMGLAKLQDGPWFQYAQKMKEES